MRRTVLLLLAVLTPVSGGCWSAPRPGRVVEYWPGQPAVTAAAPFAAEYTLYRVTSPVGDTEEVRRVKVAENGYLGFIRQHDGTLAAYAAGQTAALEEGHYRWQLSPWTARSKKELARQEMAEARRTAGQVGLLIAAASALVGWWLLCGIANN